MRFLFTGNYLPDYNRTAILKAGLKQLGHDIIEFPFEKKNGESRTRLKELAAGVDIVFLPCFTHREARFVRKALPKAKIAYDPLISHYMTKIFDYKLAWRWGIGALRSFYRDKWSQAAADLVFTDTEAHRQYFHREFGTPLEKMSVLYIGNDFKEFFPPPRERVASEPFRVGFYGGFIPLQGVMKILAAIERINQSGRGHDIHFELVGSGFEFEKAKAFVAEKKLKNVLMPGWLKTHELRERLHSFDIALGIFGDGIKTDLVIPNKVYHYAACGLPIITKDTPAIRELFADGQDLLLVNGSPESIEAAIFRLKRDSALRARLGKSAFQIINTRYNEVKIAENFISAIESRLI